MFIRTSRWMPSGDEGKVSCKGRKSLIQTMSSVFGDSLEGLDAAVGEVLHLVVPAEDGAAPLHPQVQVALEADEKVLANRKPVC